MYFRHSLARRLSDIDSSLVSSIEAFHLSNNKRRPSVEAMTPSLDKHAAFTLRRPSFTCDNAEPTGKLREHLTSYMEDRSPGSKSPRYSPSPMRTFQNSIDERNDMSDEIVKLESQSCQLSPKLDGRILIIDKEVSQATTLHGLGEIYNANFYLFAEFKLCFYLFYWGIRVIMNGPIDVIFLQFRVIMFLMCMKAFFENPINGCRKAKNKLTSI